MKTFSIFILKKRQQNSKFLHIFKIMGALAIVHW